MTPTHSTVAWLCLVLGSSATPLGAQAPPVSIADAARAALATHPEARAAQAAQAAADAGVRVATAERWPALQAEGSVFRFQEPMVVFPLHAFDPSQLTFDRTLVQGALTLGYTVFDGGARGAAVRGARANADGVTARRASADARLITEVAHTYLRALTAREELDALAQRLDAVEAERERAALLAAEGAAAQVDALRAEAAREQTMAERARATADLDAALRDLARLMGAEGTAIGPGALRRPNTPPDTPDRAALLQRLAAANPDLLRAEQRSNAAAWRSRAARGAWFPTIDVLGRYTLYGSGSSGFTGEWQGGLKVSYPLFAGGRRPRAIDRAQAEAQAAAAEADAVHLGIARALDRTYAALAETGPRIRALESAERHLMEITRIERLTLEEGAGTQAEYLRAEADLGEARAALARARYTQLRLHVELAALTGRLTVEWLAALADTDR
jgi:outer membrane protein